MEQMKILWAVDIFESHPKAINCSINFLQALSLKIKIKVDAVTVIHLSADALGAKEVSRLKGKNLELLNSSLAKARKQNWFGKSIVLSETQIAQRVAVLNLTEFAKNYNYDAILVVKHSNVSRKPHYLGSFAEITAFLSSIPVFLVNPDGHIPRQLDRICIALDESLDKEKDFKELVRFFPVKGTIVKILHRIPIPFYYLTKESIKQYVADQKRNISKSMQSIKRIGESAEALIELDIKSSDKNIGESVLQDARKGECDLIAIIHKRKGVAGFLLGGITRRVLQRADRPVLLFRP